MEDQSNTQNKNNQSDGFVLSQKPKKAYSRPAFFVITLIVVILVSSAFGAIFGFMAGGLYQKILGNSTLGNATLGKYFNLAPDKNNTGSNITKQPVLQEDSAVIGVVEKSSPAVVSIVISKDVSKMRYFFSNPFDFPNFFNPFGGNSGNNNSGGTGKQTVGGGSGFLITSDGLIVTNNHVVDDTSASYTVITNDGKEYPAKVLAADPSQDVAVIKIEGNNFPTLNFGDSSSLQIGQTVVAIGNSLGEFSNTVSRGIISGLKRSVTAGSGFGDTEKLNNIIQTDAAINPGNSGGPLLDVSGQVIGINVAMAQGAQNIGFAIPSNQVERIVDQVKTTGKISLPYIGVRYLPIDNAIQKANNLPFNYGVLIVRGQSAAELAVVPGSPADKAGIMENDIILEVNGVKIDDKNDLSSLISQYNVGSEITLKIWHKGNANNIKVKLEERGSKQINN